MLIWVRSGEPLAPPDMIGCQLSKHQGSRASGEGLGECFHLYSEEKLAKTSPSLLGDIPVQHLPFKLEEAVNRNKASIGE